MGKKYNIIWLLIIFSIFFNLLVFSLGLSATDATAASLYNGAANSFKNVSGVKGAGYNPNSPTLYNYLSVMSTTLIVFSYVAGFILIIYAGYLWMTAQGNEEQVKKAIDLIKGVVVGMVLITAAGLIIYFVVWLFYSSGHFV